MSDTALVGLLEGVAGGDLDAVLVLADFLEERQDPRAGAVRKLYGKLYDDWMFAPLAFQFHQVARKAVLELFPELPETSDVSAAPGTTPEQ
jgi:hypothetical protein